MYSCYKQQMIIEGKNPGPTEQHSNEPIKDPDSPRSPRTQKIKIRLQHITHNPLRQSQNNQKEGLILRDFHRESNCNCPAVTHQLLIEPIGVNVPNQDKQTIQDLYLQHHTNLLNKIENTQKLNIAGHSLSQEHNRKQLMQRNHNQLKAKSQPKKFSNVIAHLNLANISKSVNSPLANELKSVDIMKKVKALSPQNAVLSQTFRTSYRRKDQDSLPSKVAPICKNKDERGLSSEIQSYIQRMNERKLSKDLAEKEQAHLAHLRQRLNMTNYPKKLTANSVDHTIVHTIVPSLGPSSQNDDTSSKNLQPSFRSNKDNTQMLEQHGSTLNSKDSSRMQIEDLVQAIRVTEYPRYKSPQAMRQSQFRSRKSNIHKVAVMTKKKKSNISMKHVSQMSKEGTTDSNGEFKGSINNSKSASGSLMNTDPPTASKDNMVLTQDQVEKEVIRIPMKEGDSIWTQLSPKTPFLSVKVDYQKNKRHSSLGSDFEEENFDQYYVHNALPSFKDKKDKLAFTSKNSGTPLQLDETDIVKRQEMQVIEGQGMVKPLLRKPPKVFTGPTHRRTSGDNSMFSSKHDDSASHSRDNTPDPKSQTQVDQDVFSQDDFTAVKYIKPLKDQQIKSPPYKGGLSTNRQIQLKKLVFNIGRNAKLIQGKKQHEDAIQTGQPLLIECKPKTLRVMTAEDRVVCSSNSPRSNRMSPRTAFQPDRKIRQGRGRINPPNLQSIDKEYLNKLMNQNLDIRDVTTPPNQMPKIFRLPKGLHQIEQNAYLAMNNQQKIQELQNAATTPLATHSSLSGTQTSALKKHLFDQMSIKDHIAVHRSNESLSPRSNSKNCKKNNISNFNGQKSKEDVKSLRNSTENEKTNKIDGLVQTSIENQPALSSPYNKKSQFLPYQSKGVTPGSNTVRQSQQLMQDSLNQSSIVNNPNHLHSTLPQNIQEEKDKKSSPKKLPRVSPVKKHDLHANNGQLVVIPTELPSVKGSCIQGSQRTRSLEKKKNAQVVFSSLEKKIYNHLEPAKPKKEGPSGRTLVSNSRKRDKGHASPGDDIQTEQDRDDSSGNMEEDLYLNTSSGEYLTQTNNKMKTSLFVQKKINHPNPNVGHKGLKSQKAHSSYMKSRTNKSQEPTQQKRREEPWRQVKLSVMEFW